MVERRAGSHFNARHDLTHAFSLHFEGAMMAIRIVTGATEEHEAGPGATGAAFVGVVAGAAKAPQIVDGAIPRVAQRGRALPDVLQRIVANVAARPGFGRQRRTTLDRAVGF